MTELKPGDRVRLPSVCQSLHEKYPEWYPPPGTEGTVISVSADSVVIRWTKGTTSGNDEWSHPFNCYEKIE